MSSESRIRSSLASCAFIAVIVGIVWLCHSLSDVSDRLLDLGSRLSRVESLLISSAERHGPTESTPPAGDPAQRLSGARELDTTSGDEVPKSKTTEGLLTSVLEKLTALEATVERSSSLLDVQPDFSKPKDMFRLEAIASRLEAERTRILKEHAFVRLAKLYEMYGTPDDLGATNDGAWWSYTMRDGRRVRFTFSAGAVADIEHN
jgi:hypothetical protein